MAQRIGVVCRANVCRSPLIEFVLRDALRHGEHRDVWEITSRGVCVVDPQLEMCELIGRLLTGLAVDGHQPRAVDREYVEQQDLVLTASKAERAALARLAPRQRSAVFTVREAAALGERPMTASELGWCRGLTSEGSVLGAYAALLHSRRGLVPTDRRPSGRDGIDPLDVPDAHGGRARLHLASLRLAETEARGVAAQITGFIEALW